MAGDEQTLEQVGVFIAPAHESGFVAIRRHEGVSGGNEETEALQSGLGAESTWQGCHLDGA
jgi:hypothetical protein